MASRLGEGVSCTVVCGPAPGAGMQAEPPGPILGLRVPCAQGPGQDQAGFTATGSLWFLHL